MTIKEARKFVAVLMVTYPNYNPIDEELAAKTWADVTEEYTYEQVDIALRSYMKSSTSGFAPVPGQIIDKIHTMTQPQELNEMEAWSLVSKAIRNSGYNSVEEFAKLPPLVRKAVGLPSQLRAWALDANYREDVARSHFINCYKPACIRKREMQKMPREACFLVEKINKTSDSGLIDQKRREFTIAGIESFREKSRSTEVKRITSEAPESYYRLMSDLKN